MEQSKRKFDDVSDESNKKVKETKNGRDDEEEAEVEEDGLLIQEEDEDEVVNIPGPPAEPIVVNSAPLLDSDKHDQIVNFHPEKSGYLLFAGGTNWDLIGRKAPPKSAKAKNSRPNLYGPTRLATLLNVPIATVVSGCTSCHSMAISTEGRAYVWGRNEKGQLGLGDTLSRQMPTLLDSMSDVNIISAACGKNHTLVLTDTGEMYAMGDNKSGQCGVGRQNLGILHPTKITDVVDHRGGTIDYLPAMTRVACGGEFSMAVDVSGNLYSFGLPEYGQLGHSEDGKYFVTSSRMAFHCESRPRRIFLYISKTKEGIQPIRDVVITEVACGTNHTIAIDSKKRLYSWGFGGYGRLGHNDTKDEMIPRLLPFFDRPKLGAFKIQCGSAFNLCLNEPGAVYQWGQVKPSGDAVMYPKPIQDLHGWTVKSFACGNRSMVVLADDSVISWGPSPTYGELAYGEGRQRSSTTPQEVKPLVGINILRIACGFGHSLFIADTQTEESLNKINDLPVSST